MLGSVEGGKKCPYRAKVTVSNIGASIESVLLADYKAVVDAEDRYELLRPVELGNAHLRSLPIEKIVVDDGEELRLDRLMWRGYREESADFESVAFECDVHRAEQPILELKQRYVLKPSPADSRRYDLYSELSVRNLDDQRHVVRITQLGAVGIPQEDRRMDDRAVNVGIVLEEQVQQRNATKLTEVAETGEFKLFDASKEQDQLWWLAAENKYFAVITTPVTADGTENPGFVLSASAADLDGDSETVQDVVPRLVLGPFALAAGEATTLHLEHYIGPKDKRIFLDERNPDYLRRNFYLLNQDQLTWCTFAWLTELMVTLLNFFHAVVRNYGVAIFLLVLVVRTVLHPITKKTQVNMVKMQQSMGKLQPKLAEVKERYANDKQRLQQETMRVYKEAGVNPAGQMLSCLPMMLQMPIWIALYTSLSNNIAMRHEGFLWWINDLTAPDALIPFSGSYSVPLIGAMMGEITSFNLLPLLLAITMYAQQKLMSNMSPTKTPSLGSSDQAGQMQKQMQAMAPIMSIFFAFIFYNMPSGLNLYIMTSSVLGALEQWHIRKHVQQEKNKGAEAPVPPSAKSGPDPKKPHRPSFLERLAKKADEAQKLRKNRK